MIMKHIKLIAIILLALPIMGIVQNKQTTDFDYIETDNTPVSFAVEGDVAFMTGVITAITPAKVLELFYEHPNVITIKMIHVPGSIDDVSNLRASLNVHQFELNIKLNERSKIASGGTDFFLDGKKELWQRKQRRN